MHILNGNTSMRYNKDFMVFLFVCLVGCFSSQSTAKVMSGWSVHLSTLYSLASLTKRLLPVLSAYTFACKGQQLFLNQQKGREWP